MKAASKVFGIALILVALVAADALAQQCQARITKKSITPSTTAENTWDIQFELNVDGCAASEGTFEYVVQLEVEGRTELATVEEDFTGESAGLSTFTVAYGAPTGRRLKDVRSVRVKTCSCN